MFSKQNTRVLIRYISIVLGALLLGATLAPQVAPAAALDELIAKAKQEGALSATVTSTLPGSTTPKLAAAFKKRFGLDIEISLTSLSGARHSPKAIAATRAGTVPTYDAIEQTDTNTLNLMGVRGIQKVAGWETLLAEINPLVRSGKVRAEQLSPPPLSGYAFMYASRVKAILYNPRLISKEKLPKTHAELADPRYKGMWSHPPWTSHWDIAPLVFPELRREKWLEIVRKAGKNAGAVQPALRGVDRLLLGEYAFVLANTYYAFLFKAKDPQAPVEISYFKDYNTQNFTLYMVRRGARHPAAGTLFALWMSTPEAESIWQPKTFTTQFLWGESELDRKMRQLIQQSGANIVDYLSTEKGRDFLAWYSTKEGRKYKQDISKAIKGE